MSAVEHDPLTFDALKSDAVMLGEDTKDEPLEISPVGDVAKVDSTN